ncbi:MAG: hypothetical protein JWM33_2641 [Caulobacteraceae bacterium]|nr:hypothetical protein [Caulobacteraceae bacterium]
MVDRDFEAHLQNLFDAPPALDDTERFALLIERDLRRMRRAILWASALAAAGLAAGIYLAFDPLWSRWSSDVLTWAAQARAATPYSSWLASGAAMLVATIAAVIGVTAGKRV